MKAYKVAQGHAVTLREGIVFKASPADVAGALRVGAVVEVEDPEAAQAQPAQETQQSAPQGAGQGQQSGQPAQAQATTVQAGNSPPPQATPQPQPQPKQS